MNELILVVEDSRTQAMVLEDLLQNNNFRVAIAYDGKEALDLLNVNSPSLVLSDIVMPEMNGYELCKKIKEQNNTQHIPVILLTRLSGTDEVIQGLMAGADSFVTKPYDKEYLISHIRNILAEQQNEKPHLKSQDVEIIFEGKKLNIKTEHQQTIKLLLNIYEGAIQQNRRLLQSQEQLKSLNEHLESLVIERTLALSEETKISKQNEHLLKTITSEVQAVIFAYDAKGIFTFSEGKGLRKLGLKPGQHVGMSFFEVYKDNPNLVFIMKEALMGLARKKGGIEIDHLKFNITLQPLFDENSIVSSVVGLAIDVTEYITPQNTDHGFS